MKETYWCKPRSRASIHIIERMHMGLEADNGIWVGISSPSSPDEGGFFVKVANPGELTEKGMKKFADALDDMLCAWLEKNNLAISRKAMSFARKDTKK